MRVNEIFGSLHSLFQDWKGLLLNPRYLRRDQVITWDSALVGEFLPPRVTHRDVTRFAEAGNYSFQVATDGGLIQLYYVFDRGGDQILHGSLTYIGTVPLMGDTQSGSPSESVDASVEDEAIERDGAELAEPDIFEGEFMTGDAPVAWLRLDYSPVAQRGISHTTSHLHSALSPAMRIPVFGMPTPKQFVEAVLLWFYPDEYASLHLNENGMPLNTARWENINESSLNHVCEGCANSLLHIAVPRRQREHH